MRSLFLLLAAACGSASQPVAPVGPTPANPTSAPRTRSVTDTYHGVKVEDPYQWLEAETDEVHAWSDKRNEAARAYLAALPGLAQLREEVRASIAAPITRFWSLRPLAGKLFALRKLPDKEQPELVVMDSPETATAARLVLDPTAMGSGKTIDWYVPSPDGTKVAVSISAGGSEAGDLHVIGLDGKALDPVIPNVQRGTGGGDIAWRPDGKAFWYTRYPSAGEKPEGERDFWQQVWFHELGGSADRYELGKDQPQIAEFRVDSDARGRVLATVQQGDGGIFRHYLRDPKRGTWRQLTEWEDGVVSMRLGVSSDLWAVSIKDAPRGKLLRFRDTELIGNAKVVIPEGRDTIVTSFYNDDAPLVAGDRIYVTYLAGGPSKLRVFDLAGKPLQDPPLPDVATVAIGDFVGKDLLVFATSYTMKPTRYRYSVARNTLVEIPALSPKVPVTLDDFEVRRELATSKDGTQIPLNIVRKKGAPMDGSTPCVVTGYGGYASSQIPVFLGRQAHLLRRGVCWVDVNLRGGNEFGEDWHRAGMLTLKQNVFDDFSAALAFLVKANYTRADRTVILGGSNGGLLMGAQLTQHPEQVKAVVAEVGIYDMLRVERSINGQFNIPEYGSVKDEAQFKALFAYSPYHRVAAGVSYPPVLFTTGANDPRVASWQSRKMVAALEHAQPGGTFLLRTSQTSGHGIGTGMTEEVERNAEVTAFILAQLGVR